MSDLKISLSEEKSIDFTCVNIGGILDASTTGRLDRVLEGIIAGSSQGIFLNMASVEYISTAGWCSIILAAEALRKTDRDIYLTNMIPNVMENYHIHDFDQIIKSFESINEAKRSIRSKVG